MNEYPPDYQLGNGAVTPLPIKQTNGYRIQLTQVSSAFLFAV
jgi:hypothetical protein